MDVKDNYCRKHSLYLLYTLNGQLYITTQSLLCTSLTMQNIMMQKHPMWKKKHAKTYHSSLQTHQRHLHSRRSYRTPIHQGWRCHHCTRSLEEESIYSEMHYCNTHALFYWHEFFSQFYGICIHKHADVLELQNFYCTIYYTFRKIHCFVSWSAQHHETSLVLHKLLH